ncbi:ABC transporter permease [Clostridium beijerinckii]|uniref:ABC transporter permease n=1 Tax=Clostridium beijerinckii TaxID=1520 RepID=UPI00156F19B7|nr:ABC transporter permease [Clostridium beijerinckii]NRT71379.1 putative ABC transport system permease protein [Clostridium beijerinckii]
MSFIRALHKETRKSKFVVLSISSILLFVIIITGNINKAYDSILEFENQFTNNAIGISFDNELNNQGILNRISAIQQNKDVIVRFTCKVFDYDSNYIGDCNCEGIYFGKDFNSAYNLISGRFFNKDDFEKNNNLVVIGKDMLKYTKTEGEKRYLLNGDTEFEVIGVVGKEGISTMYDDKIIFNLSYIFNNKHFVTKDLWSVDSETLSKQHLTDIVKKVDENINIKGTIIGKRPNPLRDAINNSKELIIGGIGIIFCAIFTLFISLHNWLDLIKLEIGIRQCNGATKGNIMIIILRRYLIYSCISFITSLLLYYLLHIINFGGLFDYKINYLNLLFSVGTMIVIGFFTIIISLHKISKIEIGRLLRGR